jgi:hypothetical protein
MKKLLIPALLFVLSAVYYIYQACPTFYFWDSAELTSAILTGGVPHPPGFPALLLLSGLWIKLVPFSAPYSLNLFSAFFGALGLSLWYLVVIKALRLYNIVSHEYHIVIFSLIATIIMGISLTFSIQATRFEVYAFHFAGFAAMILLALQIAENDKRSVLRSIILVVLFAILLGAHNLTIILAVPGIILLCAKNKALKIKSFLIGLIGSIILAGLLYLDIFVRARGNPALNWGDPSTVTRFMDYILLRGFSVSSSRIAPSHILELFQFVIEVLYRQIGFVALGIAIFGAISLSRRKLSLALPFLIMLILNVLSVAFAENYFYENYDLHGYLMVSLAVLLLFMTAGFLVILKAISSRLARFGKADGALPLVITAALAIIILAIPAGENFLSSDLSRVYTARSFADEFLSSAPDSAVIITSSYNTYFCSLADQAGYRPNDNRIILNLYNWDHEWGREITNHRFGLDIKGESTRQGYYRSFLSSLLKTHPIYIEYDVSSLPLARLLRPNGLGYVLALSDTSAIPDTIDAQYGHEAMAASDLESVRTWVLWYQNRGEYFEQRGEQAIAQRYYAMVESLATKVELK